VRRAVQIEDYMMHAGVPTPSSVSAPAPSAAAVAHTSDESPADQDELRETLRDLQVRLAQAHAAQEAAERTAAAATASLATAERAAANREAELSKHVAVLEATLATRDDEVRSLLATADRLRRQLQEKSSSDVAEVAARDDLASGVEEDGGVLVELLTADTHAARTALQAESGERARWEAEARELRAGRKALKAELRAHKALLQVREQKDYGVGLGVTRSREAASTVHLSLGIPHAASSACLVFDTVATALNQLGSPILCIVS
jgi:chromosome segregation ATPase